MWAEFRKNIGQMTSEGGSCDETTAKKSLQFFSGKKRMTPPVVAPADTNPSEATAS